MRKLRYTFLPVEWCLRESEERWSYEQPPVAVPKMSCPWNFKNQPCRGIRDKKEKNTIPQILHNS